MLLQIVSVFSEPTASGFLFAVDYKAGTNEIKAVIIVSTSLEAKDRTSKPFGKDGIFGRYLLILI